MEKQFPQYWKNDPEGGKNEAFYQRNYQDWTSKKIILKSRIWLLVKTSRKLQRIKRQWSGYGGI
jgi:hypothetical protein